MTQKTLGYFIIGLLIGFSLTFMASSLAGECVLKNNTLSFKAESGRILPAMTFKYPETARFAYKVCSDYVSKHPCKLYLVDDPEKYSLIYYSFNDNLWGTLQQCETAQWNTAYPIVIKKIKGK
jgi:hypothetical protein